MSGTIVYFAGAIRGDRAAAATMRRLVQYMQGSGRIVLTEHVVDDDPPRALAEKIGKAADDLLAEDIEQQDITWLDQATHVVAEISGASTGTGREIEYARTKGLLGKTPATILVLYHIEREFYASPMIRGMTPDRYPNATIKSYGSPEEAIELVHDFLGTHP